ncbi:PREDICTED: uncharacterized protein LOC107335301 [Acropora digitifera]|uniref:uncharacterized protein LOC107335301 n=1 Tax=Acropora digitifera TaxID=70779 RepID=UPI00077A4621|nr:PREDICTED: uncharacterized protein LOC107335301 [Acropora digitifera]
MAFNRSYTLVGFVLIFGQMISITAADYDDGSTISGDDGPCAGFSSNLAEGCSISDDCSTITCNMNFAANHQITFKLKVNKCESPISVTASMTVPDLEISWSHTYTSDDIVAVPGYSFNYHDLISAGVFVQAGLTDQGSSINMKVKLLGGVQAGEESSYPLEVTVIDADLPISTDDCGFLGWWNDLPDAAKAAVIGGPILLLLIIIGICCCCCACCRACCCPSRSSSGGRTVIVQSMPPAYLATGVKSKVPMRPLVEEA